MDIVRRLVGWIGENLDTGHPLSLASIPKQRAESPDEIVARHLAPVRKVEMVGTFPCCTCCLAYSPQPCPVVHRTPCDKTECGMDWPEGAA